MNTNMRDELIKSIEIADSGRTFWNEFVKAKKITNKDAVVVVCGEDKEIDYYTVGYLKEFKMKKKLQRVFVISNQLVISKLVDDLNDPTITFEPILFETLNSLKTLFMLYKFSYLFFINSFEGTADADGMHLLNDDITVRDIVAISVLGLPSVPEGVTFSDFSTFSKWENIKYENAR